MGELRGIKTIRSGVNQEAIGGQKPNQGEIRTGPSSDPLRTSAAGRYVNSATANQSVPQSAQRQEPVRSQGEIRTQLLSEPLRTSAADT
jgi:hypothetical protein